MSERISRSNAYASMCMWEEINERTLLTKAGEYPALNRYRESVGSCSLREECLDHGRRIDDVWRYLSHEASPVDLVCSNGTVIEAYVQTRYEAVGLECFDWEFVPAYLDLVGFGEPWMGEAEKLTPAMLGQIIVALSWVRMFAQAVTK